MISQPPGTYPELHETLETQSALPSPIRCPRHDGEILGLCEECDQPVCDSCELCVENHRILLLSDFISRVFPSPPDDTQVEALAAQAAARIPEATAAVAEANRVAVESRNALATAEAVAAAVGKERAEDVNELAGLRRATAGALERAHTAAAQDALRGSQVQLEAEALVDAEAARRLDQVREARLAAARSRAFAQRMCGELVRLRFVSGLRRFPADAAEQGAFAFVAAHGTLPVAAPRSRFGAAESVAAFEAFEGAGALREVEAVLATPLLEQNGLRFSEQIELPRVPAGRWTRSCASLSAEGILCANDDERRALFVCSLPTGRAATLHGGRHMFGCVCDGELYVGWNGEATMRHAPAADALEGRDVSSFERFPLAAACSWSPRLDSAPLGFIAFSDWADPARHVLVDLRARTSRLVRLPRGLRSAGGFTGIAVAGAQWVASSGGPLFAVADSGEVREVAAGAGACPSVLPSATAPGDLTRAAIFSCGSRFTFRGRTACLERPLALADYQTLVRLYRDVFLCLGRNTGKWHLLRIVVP